MRRHTKHRNSHHGMKISEVCRTGEEAYVDVCTYARTKEARTSVKYLCRIISNYRRERLCKNVGNEWNIET